MPRPVRTPDDLNDLLAFGRWANDKICESVAQLDDAAFASEAGGSFGSVRGTLLHMYGADWVWLERFHGRSPRSMPEPSEPVTTLAQVRAKWEPIQDQLREFAARATLADLGRSLSYTSFAGEPFQRILSDALVHLVNHGTYHRGQVVTLLRQLGRSAPSTDYIRWVDASRS